MSFENPNGFVHEEERDEVLEVQTQDDKGSEAAGLYIDSLLNETCLGDYQATQEEAEKVGPS